MRLAFGSHRQRHAPRSAGARRTFYFMGRPCVCGGNNESCRYCNGRGEIADEFANALIAHSQSPKKTRGVHKSKRERDMDLAVELRERERRLERLRGPAAAPATRLNLMTSGLVRCPKGCGAQMRPCHVERHVQRVHTSPPSNQAWAAAPRSPRLGVCTICKVRVRSDRLKRHMRNVHGNRSPRASRQHVRVPSVSDVQRRDTSFVAPRDRNLDATKLYAHSYREQGRFGSHPSHDGFDDESGPN